MLDHDVFAVVGVPWDEVGMYDFPIRNGAHFVERFATRIAVQGANVHAFVEPGVNDACRCVDGITHKTVLTAFPRRGLHSFVIALDILVKSGTAA
jgi:hypothetical protein